MQTQTKLWNGRKIESEQTFDRIEGKTFGALYDAEKWLKRNGYSYGSLCREMPVAIQNGEYDLPQKWKNFKKEDKQKADGVMIAGDWREGAVRVILFEQKTIL